MEEHQLFDKVISLLSNTHGNSTTTELLKHYQTNEVTFSGFDVEVHDNKNHLLEIYEGRQLFEESKPEKFFFGYEELIPALTNIPFNTIEVCDITTYNGSYIIFTDEHFTNLIGILKSKRTSGEIRKSHTDHAALVEKFGKQPVYDYENNEVIFINGKLIKY